MSVKIEGLDEVLGNINDQVARMDRVTPDGCYEAGEIVKLTSMRRVPVDEGNLKDSAFNRRMFGQIGTVIGYSANYALAVHEDLEARHTTGQAKYLTSALHDEETRIMETIKRHAEID